MMAAFPGSDGVCTPRSRSAKKNGSTELLEAGARRAEPGACRRAPAVLSGLQPTLDSHCPLTLAVRDAVGCIFRPRVPPPTPAGRRVLQHGTFGNRRKRKKERKQDASQQGREVWNRRGIPSADVDPIVNFFF